MNILLLCLLAGQCSRGGRMIMDNLGSQTIKVFIYHTDVRKFFWKEVVSVSVRFSP